jgi:hypothetical protein
MTAEPYSVDKSTWGPGEWQDEPDRVDFVRAGFACLALRHPNHGHWCGYVGVPREHPLYGLDWQKSAYGDLNFHRGINYSAPCEEGGLICHVPAPGQPDDVWWIGGDFLHLFDFAPGMDARLREATAGAEALGAPWADALRPKGQRDPIFREVYRTLPYVRHEIEHLADELAAVPS